MLAPSFLLAHHPDMVGWRMEVAVSGRLSLFFALRDRNRADFFWVIHMLRRGFTLIRSSATPFPGFCAYLREARTVVASLRAT